LFSGTALAYGINITIYDNNGYQAAGQGGEDDETEPGMINNQSWDLEAFFINSSTLSMVGGFDFVKGNGIYNHGDIFIDVTGDAVYGVADAGGYENYGYDFVIDLNMSALTYDVFKLDSNAVLLNAALDANQDWSNPWRYDGGSGERIEFGSIIYDTGLSDSDVGLLGGSHNVVTGIDLGFIEDAGYSLDSFLVHSTLECGNDNLIGSVPEPSNMFLLGTGLIGLATIGRRRYFK